MEDAMASVSKVILLSGGMESVALLYEAAKKCSPGSVRALTVRAGQYSESKTLHYSKKNAFDLNVPLEVYDMTGIQGLMSGFYPPEWTALDEGDHECPEELSCLPVAISSAIYFCQMANAHELIVGLTKEQIRPNTKEFLDKIGGIMALYDDSAPKVNVAVPFINMTKASALDYGVSLGVDYTQTWSCHHAHIMHCGICLGCVNRKAAFKGAGIVDSTKYLA
jgi:7-cyano-7-deazaguanine synthase